MKKMTAIAALVLAFAMLFCACTPAAEQQNTASPDAATQGSLEITNSPDLVINQCITLATSDGATDVTYSVSGDDVVLLEGANLYALGSGTVTVTATSGDQTAEKTFTISPYDRVAGGVAETDFGGPVGVWVDFNAATDEIVYISITGMGNPAVMDAYGDDFAALETAKTAFYGKTAQDVAASTDTDVLTQAVQSACAVYSDENRFIIRPYQSMMTDRYLENNMHFENQTEDKAIETTIAGAWPADAVEVVTTDVLNGEDMKWPGGVSTAQVTVGDATYAVTHNVVKANAAGVALIEYRCGDTVVYDAIDIYDNFTLYPEALSGSDSYGKVVSGPADLNADVLTYRVLGDKAMNFPGGTCGSTVIDVSIDRASRTLVDVHIAEHSDSTYLYNPWEYNGGFAETGSSLYDIATFLALFKGKSADTAIEKYVLTTQDATGGTPVEGGIDMTVTGATRTPNAVIAAVNAAIEQFKIDVPQA